MVAAEVNLIRENDRELYFAHRPLSGVVFMLIGMGIVYFFFGCSSCSLPLPAPLAAERYLLLTTRFND